MLFDPSLISEDSLRCTFYTYMTKKYVVDVVLYTNYHVGKLPHSIT